MYQTLTVIAILVFVQNIHDDVHRIRTKHALSEEEFAAVKAEAVAEHQSEAEAEPEAEERELETDCKTAEEEHPQIEEDACALTDSVESVAPETDNTVQSESEVTELADDVDDAEDAAVHSVTHEQYLEAKVPLLWSVVFLFVVDRCTCVLVLISS